MVTKHIYILCQICLAITSALILVIHIFRKENLTKVICIFNLGLLLTFQHRSKLTAGSKLAAEACQNETGKC